MTNTFSILYYCAFPFSRKAAKEQWRKEAGSIILIGRCWLKSTQRAHDPNYIRHHLLPTYDFRFTLFSRKAAKEQWRKEAGSIFTMGRC
jgi:hypothetical protein